MWNRRHPAVELDSARRRSGTVDYGETSRVASPDSSNVARQDRWSGNRFQVPAPVRKWRPARPRRPRNLLKRTHCLARASRFGRGCELGPMCGPSRNPGLRPGLRGRSVPNAGQHPEARPAFVERAPVLGKRAAGLRSLRMLSKPEQRTPTLERFRHGLEVRQAEAWPRSRRVRLGMPVRSIGCRPRERERRVVPAVPRWALIRQAWRAAGLTVDSGLDAICAYTCSGCLIRETEPWVRSTAGEFAHSA